MVNTSDMAGHTPTGAAKPANAIMAMETAPTAVRPLSRRWLMLAVFCLVSLANGFQWIQFASISDRVAWYYGVSTDAVNWVALLYMVTYIPCILPASWILEKKGLRWALVTAGAGNCLAAWIKVVAVRRDLFAVLFLGQAIAALTQGFVLSVPSRLAAVWFGANQVSTACAIGVLGNQVGNALGFVAPALIVSAPAGDDSVEVMTDEMLLVGYISAGVTTSTLLLVLAVFQSAPSVPPSLAQASQAALTALESSTSLTGFLSSLKYILSSPGYLLLLGAYGISTGVCFAASIVLNELILSVFPDSDTDAGIIGLVMVFSGLVGSILCGVLLDKTAKFKVITMMVYFMSLLAIAAFAASFVVGPIWPVYVTGGFAGFFLAGYVPVGFEFGAELTYPAPEGTVSGILSAAAQLLGVLFTVACGRLLHEPRGWLWSLVTLGAAMTVGSVLTTAIPNNLRRQRAQQLDNSRTTLPGCETA